MEFIRTEPNDDLSVVWMSRGKANAINSRMLDELSKAIINAAKDPGVRGLVLASDRPGFFSGGFDVNEVFSYERPEMAEFFARFIDLYQALHRLPKPVVAAVNGHAFAGGAVLALACDSRVMTRERCGFALNEINLGVALPPGIIHLAINAVGAHAARELVLGGITVSPELALETGLASELVDADSVVPRAVEIARDLASKPAGAFAAVKRSLCALAGHDGDDRDALDEFLNHWFSQECRSLRESLVASLNRPA